MEGIVQKGEGREAQRPRSLRLSLGAFCLGATLGVSLAFEGASRGAPKLARVWTTLVLYPVGQLDELVGPLPDLWPFVIAAAIAAFVPGILCVLIMRFWYYRVSRRLLSDCNQPET